MPTDTVIDVSDNSATSVADSPSGDGLSPTPMVDLEAHAEAEEGRTEPESDQPAAVRPQRKRVARKTTPKRAPRSKTTTASSDSKRPRRTSLFPASTFEDALELAVAVYEFGAGQPVRRLTLFDSLKKSPDSGATRQLVTNSAKYGLTTGSYNAEMLALTPDGLVAVADDASPATRARARFKLAVEGIEIFNNLYTTYLGNRLPAQAVLVDKAKELGVPDNDVVECIETFTVNTKFVGVLRSISGAERLLPIDTVIDDYLPAGGMLPGQIPAADLNAAPRLVRASGAEQPGEGGSETACFYITPIGDEGTEQRKHSDLFMGALIEPTLSEFGLRLVRADQIGEAGMITGQIIEHIVYSKLVIADLSFHNPNVFYELALRHAVRKPIVQISRTADRLPFDIGQFRTIAVDTTDIYSLVPQIESLKAQIAAQIRKTLDASTEVENPLSIFAPYFWEQLAGG
jgi:hypothetical protein